MARRHLPGEKRRHLPRGPGLEFGTYRIDGNPYDEFFTLITVHSAQTWYFLKKLSLLLRMLWLHCNDVTGSERVCMKKSWSWYALFSSHIKNMFIKQGLVCRETIGEGSRKRGKDWSVPHAGLSHLHVAERGRPVPSRTVKCGLWVQMSRVMFLMSSPSYILGARGHIT